jgi:DNA-binding response OmpR family regulator
VTAAPARDDRIEIGDVVLESSMRRVTLAGDEVDLTRKEYELLALLMRNAGTVLTRERLIDEVWDTNWYGSTKTLDVHVSGLRKKLGDDAGTPRYVHTLRGVGFRFSAPAEAG